MTGLELRALTICLRMGGRPLIENLDMAIAPGEIVTVMGPSGAGKSTLLDAIGGHLNPAFVLSGKVFCNGADITELPPERRRMGILFQDDCLFPHLSVAENLAFGLPAREGANAAGRRSRIEAALAQAGLEGFADRDPASLSGGQRSRVALLRCLLAQPQALLLDEPFAKLEPRLRGEFRRFVFDHARQMSLPVLLVTHDEADAAAACGRIVRLEDYKSGSTA